MSKEEILKEVVTVGKISLAVTITVVAVRLIQRLLVPDVPGLREVFRVAVDHSVTNRSVNQGEVHQPFFEN